MAYINGVPVYQVNESAAQNISYYDWQNQMDWKDMGVEDYTQPQKYNCGGYYASKCSMKRYARPCSAHCFPYCSDECMPALPPCA